PVSLSGENKKARSLGALLSSSRHLFDRGLQATTRLSLNRRRGRLFKRPSPPQTWTFRPGDRYLRLFWRPKSACYRCCAIDHSGILGGCHLISDNSRCVPD